MSRIKHCVALVLLVAFVFQDADEGVSLLVDNVYSVSQKKVAPPKTFCDIFTYGEPV